MAKKELQPQSAPDPEIEQEVVNLMGPIPEEAAPTTTQFEEEAPASQSEPTGPPEVVEMAEEKDETVSEPEVQESTSDVSDTASEINAQLKEKVADTSEGETPSSEDALSDPTIDAAVKDIVAHESDELLAAEDAKKQDFEPKKAKKERKNILKAWWHNKRARTITLAAIAAAFLALSIYPSTRYTLLNLVGVRAGISFQVIDSKYGVPVKNVEVVVGGQHGATDADGQIKLTGVRLGKTQLVLTKRSFSPVTQTIIVGWGSNPYNDPLQMTPTGTSYSFTFTDWLSGKPIEKIAVSDGESTAVSDAKGIAVLTVEPTDKDLTITTKGTDYRTETFTISSTDKTLKTIKLVAGKPDVFVSKRSGKFDVYKRDADGKNETVILPGTGSEQEPLGLLVSPDGTTAALVSTRDGKRDPNGYLLSNLYMIDIQAKTVTKVSGTESAQIQLIEWSGSKLVFVKVAAGPSAATAGRQRIAVYDLKQDKQTELSNANYYNDVEVYKDQVYYAPSATGSVVGDAAVLYRVNTDNSAKTVLLNKETWITYRTAYDKMQASSSDNQWYEQTLGDNKMTVLSGAPASPTHRIYFDSPSGDTTIWIDNRDGKGVLLLQDLKNPSEKILIAKSGLGYPVRWLSDKHIVFRVSNSVETADYVLNIDGGDPVKIGDVSNTASTNRWYYYK